MSICVQVNVPRTKNGCHFCTFPDIVVQHIRESSPESVIWIFIFRDLFINNQEDASIGFVVVVVIWTHVSER